MSTTYTLKYLLWNNNNNHDKIWGWIQTDSGNLFCFWGKREVVDRNGFTQSGKRPSLSFKKHCYTAEIEQVQRQKLKKGYRIVPIDSIEKVVPGFIEFFEYALVTARMTGKVRTDDWA